MIAKRVYVIVNNAKSGKPLHNVQSVLKEFEKMEESNSKADDFSLRVWDEISVDGEHVCILRGIWYDPDFTDDWQTVPLIGYERVSIGGIGRDAMDKFIDAEIKEDWNRTDKFLEELDRNDGVIKSGDLQ